VVIIVAVVLIAVVALGSLAAFLKPSGQQTTPGQPTTSHSAALTADGAQWKYTDPYLGWHTSRGHYYLWINATVKNTGSLSLDSISYLDFNLFWSGSSTGVTGTAVWSSFSLAPGQSVPVVIAFSSTGIIAPRNLQFRFSYLQGGTTNASVPVPTPPADEVTLTSQSASWSLKDIYGLPPKTGNRYLWLNLTIQNRWNQSASVNLFYFKSQGVDGSEYNTQERQGADSIASGGSGAVTLVFEVPTTWMPKTLHYDMLIGPWADMTIPVPTGP
jgi:hypothetical protein